MGATYRPRRQERDRRGPPLSILLQREAAHARSNMLPDGARLRSGLLLFCVRRRPAPGSAASTASLAAASTKAATMHYLEGPAPLPSGRACAGPWLEFEAALELDPQSSFMYQQAAELALETCPHRQGPWGLAGRFVRLSTGNPSAHLILGNVRWARGDGLGGAGVLSRRPLSSGPGTRMPSLALGNLLGSESPGKAKEYLSAVPGAQSRERLRGRVPDRPPLLEQRAEPAGGRSRAPEVVHPIRPGQHAVPPCPRPALRGSRDTEAAPGGVPGDAGPGPAQRGPAQPRRRDIFLPGRPGPGQGAFQRAKAVLPDHPAACLWLALLAEAQGDFAGAAKALQESAALKDDPAISLRPELLFQPGRSDQGGGRRARGRPGQVAGERGDRLFPRPRLR